MGYHIALLLALHEFFLKQRRNPVPAFLVIDQPTQVYFPARGDAYEKVKRAGPRASADSDITRARRIFEALVAAIERTNGQLQIIVTEHADELTWGGLTSIHPVDNWRGDQYLVPVSWLK